MDSKPDGRMYSRITRRSVAIINSIQPGRTFTLSEIAQEIHSKKLPEFFLRRFNRQMSAQRTRDYLRFLRDIGVFVEKNDQLTLTFRHRNSDGEWAQALSDAALIFLAGLLKQSPQDLPEFLEGQLSNYYDYGQLPTLGNLAIALGIEGGGKDEETYKWAVYLFTDGETCQFDIRHYPVLVTKT